MSQFKQMVSDRVLDRRDIEALRNSHQTRLKEAPHSVDTRLNKSVLDTLDKYQGRGKIKMNYDLQRLQEKVSFQFDLTHAYAESDVIPGDTPEELTQYIAQKDTLFDTDSEGSRCAASSLINAYLLMGGKLEDLQKQFGSPLSMGPPTYEEMHRLQDAVYLDANTNGVKGLSLKTDYTYFFNSILSKTTTGEVSDAAQKMGMKTHPLMGNKRDDLYNHKEAVQDFFQEHPKGSIILGVSMNEETGELRPVSEEHKINHAVTVYQREGTFYLLDTGASDNGLKNSRRTLNAAEIESFIYTHRAKSFGVTLP